MFVHNRTFEGERVQKALHAVYQGVIIYAGFEKMLITGVLRCDAGITVNREHLCVTPACSESPGSTAWCLELHCRAGPTVHGPPFLQQGNYKQASCCVSHPQPLPAVLFQSSRVKRSLCLLTKLKVFSPRKTKGDFFFIKSGVCMWK